MSRSRPGILPVRAINQYRRRDVLTYLGLRYYLDAVAAQSDQWARDVATHLVLTRTESSYFRVLHFKERNKDGTNQHRPLFLPGPNEALAEAALLGECSAHPQAFGNPECVYSYALTTGSDRSGVFRPYFGGLQKRQIAIADACDACPDGEVLYTDIRQFYPSISSDVARKAWQEQADAAKLASPWRELGELLIEAHGKESSSPEGRMLIGPMFSHLVGNLVLRELDEECSKGLKAKYVRYVDDIALVGEAAAVTDAVAVIRSRLSDLGLQLHDDDSPKTHRISAGVWLESRDDFHESRRPVSWMTLVGDLKKFLLWRSDEADTLHKLLRDRGYRIPVRDYSALAFEAGYLEKVRRLAERSWFRRLTRNVSPGSIISQANYLQKAYQSDFTELVEQAERANAFQRKRLVPKLRYRAGRLIYLAQEEALIELSRMANQLPELHFHAAVMAAVASGDIDQVISLGTNAAQATAQPLRAAGRTATCSLGKLDTEAQAQALTMFLFNGVVVRRPSGAAMPDSDLMKFAFYGANLQMMMTSGSTFMRELSSLHGITNEPRHATMMETAFDQDEALTMDAIDQLQQSISA